MKSKKLSALGSVITALAFFMVVLAPAVAGQTYALTVKTDSSNYSASQAIHFIGTVTPAPGSANSPSAVYLEVSNPDGAFVIEGAPLVNGTTGAYSFDAVAGGTSQWVAGTYKVTATWGANGAVISATTTFSYTPQVVTTSSTSSTTSHTSTSTSTSSTTTSTSASVQSSTTTTFAGTSQSMSSSGGGGIPEFPFSFFVAAVFTIAVVGAYLVVRRQSLPGVRTPQL